MNRNILALYGIAGPQNFKDTTKADALTRMKDIIASGITAFQYRDKGTTWESSAERVSYVQELRDYAKHQGVPFIINDDVALALAVGADGIHVGQNDMKLEDFLQMIPTDMYVGLSINTLTEMQDVLNPRIDYLGLGPIYPTLTKKDATPSIGVPAIPAYLDVNRLGLPIVGIGGISLDNMAELKTAGLDGVAVISLLTEAPDLARTLTEMTHIWENTSNGTDTK
ncbi:thiamine phosphate synthase [Weissella tructae]|uniref:Thiamine-phosphate synthase n=2 Tax=Weissella TaxID=46255 RepID=A0A075U006_9LACO|nr:MULTISPECIES: thiamine phosphate synthase [Weissella]AIG65518.1 Thiamine-phosphate synthase [Weissella tructae]AIM62832.1 Thiamine-phosphate synthase [Weissella ceti]AIM64167.1 Thiamine-phosphate synthase [Weissella ceti]ELA07023.1 thiamine-phosphate pyrophosphorylase [Weissella ceti NC36]QVV91890.1 thiamine phosphate synthase [Weissella tructae]